MHLIFKCYLFKVRDTRKISSEGLKKDIFKIYNIEKQMFQQPKKDTKFLKNGIYQKTYYDERNLLQKVLGWEVVK